jgi:hypothetical protein
MHNQHAELSQPSSTSPNGTSRPPMHDWSVALGRRVAGAGRGRSVAGGSWPAGQPSSPSSQPGARTASVDRSEAPMSKLARALILAATLAALNLAGLTAVAQANDQDPTSQQELAENWNDYQQATRVPPAELKARRQADATQRQLSENWTYYYHATRMSPAELKAWMQAKDRADTSTEPPAQVPAPVRPPEPTGQPGWLVVSLGGLAAALAVVAGLALVAARRANRRARVGQVA